MPTVYTKVTDFRNRFGVLCSENEKPITDLAKELHVSYQTISAWRLGTRSPKEPTIIAIAHHFGIQPLWLMGFDCPRTAGHAEASDPLTTEGRVIASIIDRLSKKQREQALSVIRAMFPER